MTLNIYGKRHMDALDGNPWKRKRCEPIVQRYLSKISTIANRVLRTHAACQVLPSIDSAVCNCSTK